MPVLCMSSCGTAFGDSDIGLDLVLGKAAFNLFQIAACGLAAREAFALTGFPLARDCVCLAVCFALLTCFLIDGHVQLWEALALVALYAIYVGVMKLNRRLEHLFRNGCSGWTGGGAATAVIRDVVPDLSEEVSEQPPADAPAYQFYVLRAARLRELSGALPRFQELVKEPGWFGEVHIGVEDLKSGVLHTSVLSVSHRWYARGHAFGADGEKMAALQGFLRAHPEVEWVWIDWGCLPQERWSDDGEHRLEERTQPERALFKRTLPTVNYLFLGTKVLLIVDAAYLARFWTQFEAFLSLQCVGMIGIVPTPSFMLGRRTHCRVCGIQKDGGVKSTFRQLRRRWGNIPVNTAIDRLSKSDVEVTNRGDKDVCLGRLRDLNKKLKKEMQELRGGERHRSPRQSTPEEPEEDEPAPMLNVLPPSRTAAWGAEEQVAVPDPEDEVGDDEFDALRIPKFWTERARWLLQLPITMLWFCTPRPTERLSRWCPCLAISGAIIAGLCFLVVWWADVVGTALGIPTVIFGGVAIPAFQSYAGLMRRITAAREGDGDIAVSSLLGSRVFEVGICLGLPWACRTHTKGQNGSRTVAMLSPAAAFLALYVLAFIVLSGLLLGAGWRLSSAKAVVLALLYCGFVAAACGVGSSDSVAASLFLG